MQKEYKVYFELYDSIYKQWEIQKFTYYTKKEAIEFIEKNKNSEIIRNISLYETTTKRLNIEEV